MAVGPSSVLAKAVVETPSGVILLTVSETKFAV